MKFDVKLKFTQQHNCFLNLPKRWTAQTADPLAVRGDKVAGFRLSCSSKPGDRSVVVASSGKSSYSDNFVEIDEEFARILDLKPDQEVSLELMHEAVSNCACVKLAPVNSADWPEIASLGEFIEDNLLQCVRIVSVGLCFPLWIPSSGKTVVRLRILEMTPKDVPALLCTDTMIHLIPDLMDSEGMLPSVPPDPVELKPSLRPVKQRSSSLPDPTRNDIWAFGAGLVFNFIRNKIAPPVDTTKSRAMRNFSPAPLPEKTPLPLVDLPKTDQSRKRSVNLRIQEIWISQESDTKALDDIILVSVTDYLENIDVMEDIILAASVSLVPIPCRESEKSLSFDVSLRLLGCKSKDFIKSGHVGITAALMRNFNVSNCDQLKVTFSESSLQAHKLAKHNVQDSYSLLSRSVKDDGILLTAFPALFDHLVSYVALALSLTPLTADIHPPKSSTYPGIFLFGLFGTGKSTVLSDITGILAQWPYLVHTATVECKYLRGRRPDSLRKILSVVLQEAVHKQPAVVFFDDLEYLAPNVTTDNDIELEYAARVAQILVDLQDNLQAAKARVVMVGSAMSRNLVHALLVDSGTSSVFQSFCEIPVLDWSSRLGLLKYFYRNMESNTVASPDMARYADITDGYILRDFALVFKRLSYEQVLQGNNRKSLHDDGQNIPAFDLEKAFSATVPHFKQAVDNSCTKLSLDNTTWADVGGLADVKKILKEMFELPVRYPKLYSKCPMRLPKGALLFGLPGTGKTFIAGILAKQLNVGFIHVRGPELLSKYIGASEAKVRDVFQRAKAAKPCLVFFDEFEAIAPRRGHDSTGVTDRVVNQLLTELDGIESQEAYVLAATSRPELIDPAVLRPGRIDKCLYCPLPNADERMEILTAIGRKITLDGSVDLRALAGTTEHYSGADLKAILVDAQLDAVESGLWDSDRPDSRPPDHNETVSLSFRSSLVDDPSLLTPEETERITRQVRTIALFSDGLGGESNPAPEIIRPVTNENILKAFHGMLPSVSEEEIVRFERLADDIIRNGVSSLQENRRGEKTPMRVSLA